MYYPQPSTTIERDYYQYFPDYAARDMNPRLLYDSMRAGAWALSHEVDLTEDRRRIAFRLLDDFRKFDQTSAIGVLRATPIALTAAAAIEEATGAHTDEGEVVVGTLTHDIGKRKVGRALVHKSNRGKIWGHAERLAMQPHAYHSGKMVREAGLGDELAETHAESHAKQLTGGYTNGHWLSFRQRRLRDSDFTGDAIEAQAFRNNTLTEGLQPIDRLRIIRRTVLYVFDDYAPSNTGEIVFERVRQRMEPYLPEVFAHNLGSLCLAAA